MSHTLRSMSEYIASYGVRSTPLYDFILPVCDTVPQNTKTQLHIGENKHTFYRRCTYVIDFLKEQCSDVLYQLYFETTTNWGTNLSKLEIAIVENFESNFDFIANVGSSGARGGVGITGKYNDGWFLLVIVPSSKQTNVIDIKGFFENPVNDNIEFIDSVDWTKSISDTGLKNLSVTDPHHTCSYKVTATAGLVSHNPVPLYHITTNQSDESSPTQSEIQLVYQKFSSYPFSFFLYYPDVSEQDIISQFI